MSTIEFNQQLTGISAYLENFAYSLTHDEENARDLFQETIYKAMRYKEHFTLGTNFRAWISTIMRNIFINDWRRKSTRKTSVENFDEPYLVENFSTTHNEGEQNMERETIEVFINALPEKLRKPFLMSVEGFAYQEIADEMQVPLGTIKSRIFFAREKLQKDLLRIYPSLENRLN
jgi:RNA polymerase sigma-70 factor (ECF subfamily)